MIKLTWDTSFVLYRLTRFVLDSLQCMAQDCTLLDEGGHLGNEQPQWLSCLSIYSLKFIVNKIQYPVLPQFEVYQ